MFFCIVTAVQLLENCSDCHLSMSPHYEASGSFECSPRKTLLANSSLLGFTWWLSRFLPPSAANIGHASICVHWVACTPPPQPPSPPALPPARMQLNTSQPESARKVQKDQVFCQPVPPKEKSSRVPANFDATPKLGGSQPSPQLLSL